MGLIVFCFYFRLCYFGKVEFNKVRKVKEMDRAAGYKIGLALAMP